MVELEIRDFQSIEHTKFQIEGLSVVVGRSNIGKSAIVRAITYALTAASGTDFVRHGDRCERRTKDAKRCKCFSSVRIKTPAIEFTWKKGDSVNQYEVLLPGATEPVLYDKVGQGVPDFLSPDFDMIRIGSSSKLVQISDQFNPIFLLDQSGNTVADVLSDVAKLDQINVALGLVNKDRKSAAATKKVREQDILQLGVKLQGFAGFDIVKSRVATVTKKLDRVNECTQVVESLSRYISRVLSLQGTLQKCRGVLDPPFPESCPLGPVVDKLSAVDRYQSVLVQKAARVRELRGVVDIVLPDPSKLADAVDTAQKLDALVARGALLVEKNSRLQGASEIDLPEALDVGSRISGLKDLHNWQDRLEKLALKVRLLESELQEAASAMDSYQKEIQELGVCPTCSKPFSEDVCLRLE